MPFDQRLGTSGDDIFTAEPDLSIEYDGGEGVDEVFYDGAFEDYSFALNGYVLEITKPSGAVDRLIDIEFISFSNLPDPYSYHQLLNEIATDGDDHIRMPSGLDYEVVDVVDGGAGSDVFYAGDDAMLVDGGGDEYDQVNYPGASADYVFRQIGLAVVEVERADGTIDVLTAIDGVYFQGEPAWYEIDDLIASATYRATDGDDVIRGTNGDDEIQGGAGSDTFIGAPGDNVWIGGSYEVGDNRVSFYDVDYDQINYSGQAADYLFMLDASSYIGSNRFIQVLRPDGGIDLIHGIEGVWFYGEQAWYSIDDLAVRPAPEIGTEGDDVFTLPEALEEHSYRGEGGDDLFISNDEVIAHINGGYGADEVVYPGGIDDYELTLLDRWRLELAKSNGAFDELHSVENVTFGDETYSYHQIIDHLMSDADDFVFMPNTLDYEVEDVVDGEGGSDTFSAGDNAMIIDGGGDEYDQVNYPGAPWDYEITQIGDDVFVERSDGTIDILRDIDGVWFDGEGVWYSIETLIDSLVYRGTEGDDVLRGSAGDDVVEGWTGSDTFVGSQGYNVFIGGSYTLIDDVMALDEDDDYDQLNYQGHAEDYIFIAGQTYQGAEGFVKVIRPDGGVDLLYGVDGVWFFDERAWYAIDSLTQKPFITGTPENDYIFGDDGDNIIQGGEGSDKIDPGAGDNVVFGGSYHMDGDALIIDPDGAYDQIDYAGALADYQFIGGATYQGVEGFIQVIRPDGGTDLLNGVEGVWFAADQAWARVDDLKTINGFSKTDFDFIAMAGQSNAERYFFRAEGDDSPGELGFVVFQDAMEALSGFSARLIEAARSGSGSNENADPVSYWWDLANDAPGPELIAAIETISAALGAGGDLDAIIWAQGEDDARLIQSLTEDGPQVAADLKYATTKVFETFWATFGEDVPIFIQHLATDFPEEASSYVDGPEGALAMIRAVQEELVAELANVYFGADPTGEPHFDSIHYTNEGYGDIAKDLALSVFTALNADQDDPAAQPASPTSMDAAPLVDPYHLVDWMFDDLGSDYLL